MNNEVSPKKRTKISLLSLVFLLILIIPVKINFNDNNQIDNLNEKINFSATWEDEPWVNIPLYGENGGALFDYATALSRTILFYEAEKCGSNENNRFNWRGDCHTNDGAWVTLSDGTEYWIDATGGYHDAGDHIKFGICEAYTASTLGWGFYQYREQYEETGEDVYILEILKEFSDYFIKCHPEKDIFLYHVGSGTDHTYWGPPETQLDSECPREVSIATPENPATDVWGNTAASLAIMYLNYYNINSTYANICLDHALQMYDLGTTYFGLSDGHGFYPSASFWDDLAWAAIWLYKATGQESYLDDLASYTNAGKGGLDDDDTIENGINWVNYWTHCWDVVWGGTFVVAAQTTGHPAYIEQAEANIEYWMGPELECTPGGMKARNYWGVLRYSTAEALMALVYYDYSGNEIYRDFAASQINYALGANPLNMSYIVGYGEKSAEHPHHRAAHGSETLSMTDPENHTHVLYGALVGGPDANDEHNDVCWDYVQNEVTIDYNAGIVGALAGMRKYFGEDQQPEPDPAPEEPIEAYYVEAKLVADNTQRSQVSLYIHNHAIHPPHYETEFALKYFVDLSELYDYGYSVADCEVALNYNWENAADLSDLIPYDEANHIYQVIINYSGYLLYAKAEFQFTMIFNCPDSGASYKEVWDSANDFSIQGFTDGGEELAKNYFMPIYREGELIWGQEPNSDKIPPDEVTGLSAEAIGSAQINLDWNDNIEEDLSFYKIYRSESSSFSLDESTFIDTSKISSFSDTELIAETTYYYMVTAVDTSLNEGYASNIASDITLTPDAIPPEQVTGLIASGLSSTSIQLNWDDNTDADLSIYKIYRGLSTDFICDDNSLIDKSLISEYADAGLPYDSTYFYKISALDTSGNEGIISIEASASTLSAPLPIVKLEYICDSSDINSVDIVNRIKIYNMDSRAISVSDLSIRYWFNSEPDFSSLDYSVDHADMGVSNINCVFDIKNINTVSYEYYEIQIFDTAIIPTWCGGDGTEANFPIGANTGEIKTRVFDSTNVVQFDQSNDWSFDSSVNSSTEYEKITVYYKENLIWGQEPEESSDISAPVLTVSPSDVSYKEGVVGNTVSWVASDLNPNTYIITLDGVEVHTGTWISDSAISISIDGLLEGIYAYEITFYDEVGNYQSDELLVSVSSSGTTTYEIGDVNHDSSVTIVDALLVAQYYVGESVDIDETLADVNLDGSINIVDALLIAQYYVGQIDVLPYIG